MITIFHCNIFFKSSTKNNTFIQEKIKPTLNCIDLKKSKKLKINSLFYFYINLTVPEYLKRRIIFSACMFLFPPNKTICSEINAKSKYS